jgi:release factor glutamine methyltransferase
MQLSMLLANAIEKLKNAGVDNPQLAARVLVGYALKLDCAQILSQSQRVLTQEEISVIDGLMARRAKGESVSRIMGRREFWSLDFGLNEATLDPRPDSETVVEAVLKLRIDGKRILDLGTGTGCLLLALLHEMPEATGIGIDIAPRAVEQAAKNAEALRLGGRAKFRIGSWLEGVTEKFDVIISNPPYIPSAEIPTLMREVREFDPLCALDGGKDGLDPYRLLIPQLANFLNPRGLVAFEVGGNQAHDVADLFRKNGFADVGLHKDLAGIERCVTGLGP